MDSWIGIGCQRWLRLRPSAIATTLAMPTTAALASRLVFARYSGLKIFNHASLCGRKNIKERETDKSENRQNKQKQHIEL